MTPGSRGMKSIDRAGPDRAWLSVCIWPVSPVTEEGSEVEVVAVFWRRWYKARYFMYGSPSKVFSGEGCSRMASISSS